MSQPTPFTPAYYSQVFAIIKDLDVENIIPRAEVAHLKTLTDKEDTELYYMLAFNRVASRICNSCGYKDDIYKLKPCESCQLTYYCDDACRQNDSEAHGEWCCKPDGPRDMGYLQTTAIKKG